MGLLRWEDSNVVEIKVTRMKSRQYVARVQRNLPHNDDDEVIQDGSRTWGTRETQAIVRGKIPGQPLLR